MNFTLLLSMTLILTQLCFAGFGVSDEAGGDPQTELPLKMQMPFPESLLAERECSICLEKISHSELLDFKRKFVSEAGGEALSCKHLFHAHCIDSWVAKKLSEGAQSWSCPECRLNIRCPSPAKAEPGSEIPTAWSTTTDTAPEVSGLNRCIHWLCCKPLIE